MDGDLYNVTEFVPLHPSKLYEAAAYPPADRLELNRPSTMEDVADFVVDYINNNVMYPESPFHFKISHFMLILDSWPYRDKLDDKSGPKPQKYYR